MGLKLNSVTRFSISSMTSCNIQRSTTENSGPTLVARQNPETIYLVYQTVRKCVSFFSSGISAIFELLRAELLVVPLE